MNIYSVFNPLPSIPQCDLDLITASKKGRKETVLKLLQSRANPNTRTDHGMTALTLAVMHQKDHIIKPLLQAKADPNIQHSWRFNALVIASRDSDSGILPILLQANANPNIQDYLGISPLMEASKIGNIKNVQMLLLAKGDPNLQDHFGKSALSQAICFNRTEIVRVLDQTNKLKNLKLFACGLVVAERSQTPSSLKRFVRNPLLELRLFRIIREFL